MAMKGLSIAVAGFAPAIRPVADADAAVGAINTAIDLLEANSLGNLTTAVAAAQVIGAGDASAEVDAADLALIELTAAIAAVQTSQTAAADTTVTGDVIVQVGTTVTRAQLVKALEAALRYFTGSSGIITS